MIMTSRYGLIYPNRISYKYIVGMQSKRKYIYMYLHVYTNIHVHHHVACKYLYCNCMQVINFRMHKSQPSSSDENYVCILFIHVIKLIYT